MSDLLPLDPDQLLSTTRSVRKRLDFDRPVDPSLLAECVDLALQAPTGSLRQDWHFVLTTDRDQCREVGAVYKRVWNGMVDKPTAQTLDPASPRTGNSPAATCSASRRSS